jgi:hypothetical protein
MNPVSIWPEHFGQIMGCVIAVIIGQSCEDGQAHHAPSRDIGAGCGRKVMSCRFSGKRRLMAAGPTCHRWTPSPENISSSGRSERDPQGDAADCQWRVLGEVRVVDGNRRAGLFRADHLCEFVSRFNLTDDLMRLDGPCGGDEDHGTAVEGTGGALGSHQVPSFAGSSGKAFAIFRRTGHREPALSGLRS